MGADGGYCWIRVKDKEKADRLTKWLHGSVCNYSSKAYKHTDEPESIPSDTYFGGYGTDCEYDWSDLISVVEAILEGPWYIKDVGDVTQYTFGQLLSFMPTDIISTDSLSVLGPIRKSLSWLAYEQKSLPPDVRSMTLRDWARGVEAALDLRSFDSEETWT